MLRATPDLVIYHLCEGFHAWGFIHTRLMIFVCVEEVESQNMSYDSLWC